MVGTIIWTIPKPDNINKNDYDHDYDHYQQASDKWHTRWIILQSLNNSMAIDDLMARQCKQTFLIRYDQVSPHRLDNLMIQWMLQLQDVRENYNADRKINSERYPF